MDTRFKTRDLYESAALYSLNAVLITLEKEDRQYHFVFEDFQKCKELSDQYWRGSLRVNAKVYADAIRTLKDRIFAQR